LVYAASHIAANILPELPKGRTIERRSTPPLKTDSIEANWGRVVASAHSSLIKSVDHWAVDALGAPHVGERPEKELIASFVGRVAELAPPLMTFNGNTFDLPVLRYRAMIHAVAEPGLTARPYFNPYIEDALDLCDVLSFFAPHTKASLNELSSIMGLPGKPDRMNGSEVERSFLDGKIKEIADYCESDVVNTYRVWLRHELFEASYLISHFKRAKQT
jgi:predicted PolB exonuclease-like 3'-5' exonuclease